MILLAALLAAAHPHPSAAGAAPSLSRWEREKPAQPAKGEGERETPDQVAIRYRLAGELLVSKGDRILLDRGYGTIAPSGGAVHKAGERWRLASITKQIVAVQLLRELGIAALDRPVDTARWSQKGMGGLTLRQLLTHHSGLANPDDTPAGADGVPAFYRKSALELDYCLSKPPTPGAAFAYNNCDYIVAGMQLGGALDWQGMAPPGVRLPTPGERGVPGFVAGKPEPKVDLGSWYTAGMFLGSARAVFAFDRSLMTGRLLPPKSLAELWKPEGNGSYQALGQWVFPGKLKGCAAPKRIVQRDGEIYGVQARNFILPDDDMVVIVFTNRSSDDFPLGEVWEGKGFVYDLLSAVACA